MRNIQQFNVTVVMPENIDEYKRRYAKAVAKIIVNKIGIEYMGLIIEKLKE